MIDERAAFFAELEALHRTNRLIRLDYSYNTKGRARDAASSAVFRIIDRRAQHYAAFLERAAGYAACYERIPVHASSPQDPGPNWVNGWIPGFDAITLYALLALHNPRTYFEIGSGNSTKFARLAIQDHGLRTRIVSIDPYPRAEIDSICDEAIRQRCEDLEPAFFDRLTGEDLLFVDNSHRSFQNSDVTVFFTDILPNLPSGIIYGLHDIFLPWDYPDQWQERYYNEQYLLAAYLLGGAGGDEIVCPNAYIVLSAPALMQPLRGTLENPRLAGIESYGCAFWLRRGPRIAD